ncbi:hypothetical protein EVAR_14215_1 [Eumeta japonica]|uniref:Uncharacterized protein n=1 Tax=Eumeta variegata TaxID=151549 RepID=A0A4C1UEJ9_EUMVA|nr:hypothetical protein EVAR_14215_1 [Eumeta japonica]
MAITLFHYAPCAALLRVVIRACSGACAITYITFTGITYHSMLFRRLAIKLFTLISEGRGGARPCYRTPRGGWQPLASVAVIPAYARFRFPYQ